jgi:hypothetical protein
MPQASYPRLPRKQWWAGLARNLLSLWKGRYDPAKHYMRGPGPKTLRRQNNGSGHREAASMARDSGARDAPKTGAGNAAELTKKS